MSTKNDKSGGESRKTAHSSDVTTEPDAIGSRSRGELIGPRFLPTSLPSLRAFEAVARRKSFTNAALELNQTQTAISHQIKKLEEMLGVQLLIRDRHGVRLSYYGQDYLPAVRNALDVLSSATRRILEHGDEGSISIVSLAAFGLKCLLPLLPEFEEKYPNIHVHFETMGSYSATPSYSQDIAFRYGSGDWAGMVATKVGPEELFPICSPEFLKKHKIETVSDISRVRVITTSSMLFRDDWPEWLELAGASDIQFGRRIVCDTMLSAYQSALDGLGIGLGRRPLVDRDLAAGRLVAPFAQKLSPSTGYYLTIPADREQRKIVQLFATWFLGRIRETWPDSNPC